MIYEAETECFKQKERPLQTPEAGMSLVYSRNRKLGSVAASKGARGRIGCDGVWVRDGGPSQEAQDPSGPCSSAAPALTLIRKTSVHPSGLSLDVISSFSDPSALDAPACHSFCTGLSCSSYVGLLSHCHP